MAKSRPSPKGVNGDRDRNGRFTKGCRGGPGNPLGKRIAQLRTAIIEAVSEEDIRRIVQSLVRKAIEGDTHAAAILFERTVGRPVELDVIERIESLEAQLSEGTA